MIPLQQLFITAACMKPGSVNCENILFNKTRVGFIKTLKAMGGNIKIISKKRIHVN